MTLFTAFVSDRTTLPGDRSAVTVSVVAKRSEQQVTPALAENFTIGEGLLENLCGPCSATVSILRINGLKIDLLVVHPGLSGKTTEDIRDRIEQVLSSPGRILRYINNPVVSTTAT